MWSPSLVEGMRSVSELTLEPFLGQSPVGQFQSSVPPDLWTSFFLFCCCCLRWLSLCHRVSPSLFFTAHDYTSRVLLSTDTHLYTQSHAYPARPHLARFTLGNSGFLSPQHTHPFRDSMTPPLASHASVHWWTQAHRELCCKRWNGERGERPSLGHGA